jgi:transposase
VYAFKERRLFSKAQRGYFCGKKAMFSINENHQLYLYHNYVDLRKGFNALSGIVNNNSEYRPSDGKVYVFINRQRNTMKLLHWERGGFVIYHKRLEQGRMMKFKRQSEEVFHLLRWDELVLLLEGVNPNTKRRKRFNISG